MERIRCFCFILPSLTVQRNQRAATQLWMGWAGCVQFCTARPTPALGRTPQPQQCSSFCFNFFLFFLILALSTKYFSVFGMNAGRNGAGSKQALCFQYWCFNGSVTVVLADCSSSCLPANIFWFLPLSFLTPAPCYQLLALGLC